MSLPLSSRHVDAFAHEFAAYLGARHAVPTSFGRTALYLGLRALDVNQKEVILPSFICTVVRQAVVNAGAVPRFVDVDPDRFTYDIGDLQGAICPRTRAIILVHYFGSVARNLHDVARVARENSLALIEDCAHAMGAEASGQKIGTFGDLSIFSLTKGMINFGGGVLVTNDDRLQTHAKEILAQEHIPLRRRTADFPLVLAYGLEQTIDKLILDRVRGSGSKWWLATLPKALVQLRKFALILLRRLSPLPSTHRRISETPTTSAPPHALCAYPQGIRMEPLVAFLATIQLRNLDALIARRREIHSALSRLPHTHLLPPPPFSVRDVATHLLFRFPGIDIGDMAAFCKRHGLLLRPTWPTHQTLWEQQSTRNVRLLEKEMLIWNVSARLNCREKQKFAAILEKATQAHIGKA